MGFANFNAIFRTLLFWQAVRVTLYFTVVSLAIELVLGIGMALVLNQPFKGRSLVRSLILLPWAVPTVVNARMWEWIYAGSSFGALNGVMKVLHLFPPSYDRVWLSFDVPFRAVPLLGPFLEWLGVTYALHMVILATGGGAVVPHRPLHPRPGARLCPPALQRGGILACAPAVCAPAPAARAFGARPPPGSDCTWRCC
ncbi:MAG TPA: sugar ABC transporter permease [Firmicutes bacterium]|nr:sugar ABC transporter permease [Bacillota bacterium]